MPRDAGDLLGPGLEVAGGDGRLGAVVDDDRQFRVARGQRRQDAAGGAAAPARRSAGRPGSWRPAPAAPRGAGSSRCRRCPAASAAVRPAADRRQRWRCGRGRRARPGSPSRPRRAPALGIAGDIQQVGGFRLGGRGLHQHGGGDVAQQRAEVGQAVVAMERRVRGQPAVVAAADAPDMVVRIDADHGGMTPLVSRGSMPLSMASAWQIGARCCQPAALPAHGGVMGGRARRHRGLWSVGIYGVV